jgi:hypothetical protein
MIRISAPPCSGLVRLTVAAAAEATRPARERFDVSGLAYLLRHAAAAELFGGRQSAWGADGGRASATVA